MGGVAQRTRHNPDAAAEPSEQQAIRAYMQELRRRFVDHAKLTSTATRAWRLFERARRSYPAMDLNGFTGYLEQAASITADRKGQMPYLFSVVESLLWPAERRMDARPTTGSRRQRTVGGPLVRVGDRRPVDEIDPPGGAPEPPLNGLESPKQRRSVSSRLNGLS